MTITTIIIVIIVMKAVTMLKTFTPENPYTLPPMLISEQTAHWLAFNTDWGESENSKVVT